MIDRLLRSARFAFGMTVLVGFLLLGYHVPPKLVVVLVMGFGLWVSWRLMCRKRALG